MNGSGLLVSNRRTGNVTPLRVGAMAEMDLIIFAGARIIAVPAIAKNRAVAVTEIAARYPGNVRFWSSWPGGGLRVKVAVL